MLHFYHHPHSPYSQKIFMLLEELRVPYDLRIVGLERGEHRQAAYLEINPAARVPVIKDGEFMLGESNAIMRYLTRKYERFDLYPNGLQEQANVDLWWEYCSHHINKPLLDLAWNKILYKQYHGTPDVDIIHRASKNLKRDLPVLDRHLMGRNFVAGADVTLADINLLPFLVYAPEVLTFGNFGFASAWLERVSRRPSWQTVAAYSGRLARS